jgi:predicted DCC family thiol-disulfide oxidoreductase YuxK
MATSGIELPEHLLLFDGVCNLCSGSVQFIIKRDRVSKFKFAALQSVAGIAVLKQLGISTQKLDTFVYVQKGHVKFRSNAVLQMLRDLGGFWKFCFGLTIIPRPIRDFVYYLVAKSRYRIFGKKDQCMVPMPELKERFL